MARDETRADDDVRDGSRSTPPWTVLASCAAVAAQAVMIAEHARRLLAGVVTSEETLGLAALGPLDREVPAAVIEGFIALGLFVAAIAILRRSRLALAYAETVQAVVLVDVVLRVARGLAFTPTVVMFALAAAIASLLGAPTTRRWCDVPIWPGRHDERHETVP